MKEFKELYNELYAISLAGIDICTDNKRKIDYLAELIVDFKTKLEGAINKEDETFYRECPTMSFEKIKHDVMKDKSLDIDQKLDLCNNFTKGEIKSKSQVRRLGIQRDKNVSI